jgi:hypothetical protein
VFRRKRSTAADDESQTDGTADEGETVEAELDADGETDAGPAEDGVTDALADAESAGSGGTTSGLRTGPSPDAPEGPFDEADAPDDDLPRVDLGAMRVPIIDGVELRLEVNEQGELGQVLLVEGANIMQVGAFAAPRSNGIWDEVRGEILGSVNTSGGTAEEVEGLYGIELAAQVPTGTPGQLAPARFLGIDRPRWFVRALLSGPAAVDPTAAELLLNVLAGTVVVRGKDAMPIRDAIPLRLPKEAAEAAEAGAAAAAEEEDPGLEHLGPGPTITETR